MRRTLLLVLLLGLPPALAGPELTVPVGPAARVQQLPRLDPLLVELQLFGVDGDLTRLRDVDTPGIDKVGVTSGGGGDWLVRLRLIDPQTHLVAELSDGRLVLNVEPGATPSRSMLPGAPSVEALLANTPVSPPPEAMPPMSFLHGEALAGRLELDDYPLRLGEPDWLSDDPGGWHRLEEDRLAYLRARDCASGCEQEEAAALFRLGWRYLEMGWSTEGRHYINKLPTDDAAIIEPLSVALARTRASLGTGEWDEARAQLSLAWELGAPLPVVAEGLGMISLASGVPARGPTGRLLASVTATPHAQLLAANLLQIDGQFEETIPILLPLLDLFAEAEAPGPLAQAALRLGDAYLLSGKIDEARRAWQQAEEPLRNFRAVYAEVYRSGSENWIAALPALEQWGAESSALSAEALYLIAQIDESMGIDVDAIDRYTAFIDAHPATARRSDAAERLWSLYSRRARRMIDKEQWFLLAALHESAWREVLYDQIDDPTVLWDVARGYEALGLSRQALEVLSTGFGKLVSESRSEPEMTFHLAKLYEHIGNSKDGLRTLEYLRSSGMPESMEGEVALLSGRMLQREDPAAALKELQRARKVPALRDEADLLIARIEVQQDRCDRAVGPMERLLLSDAGLLRWTDSAPYLELSRCAVSLGRLSLAAAAAAAAAERASSPEEARYAGYLSQIYSDPAKLPSVLEDGDDIWAQLGAESVAAEAFEATLDRRLGP